ncbi:MAG: DUF5702 domain-containing protein [Clostridiaceae bacterium]|nr:DUF5702 domain-containing protein [Clostridiaceae bacterium]
MNKRGSLAIFFCLVFAALVTVFGVWLQAVTLRVHETDIARAMSAQIQTHLASYDRNLYEEFGLFGFKQDTADCQVFKSCLPDALQNLPLTIQARDPVLDQDILRLQIIRHMKARVPMVYLDDLAGRIRQFSAGLPDVQSSGAIQPAKVLTHYSAGSRTYRRMNTVLLSESDITGSLAGILQAYLQDVPGTSVESTAKTLFGNIMEDLQEKILFELKKQYRQYASSIAGVSLSEPDSALLDQMPDFLDPGNLTAAAGKLDKLLSFDTSPVYEKLCLTEYVMGYFLPRVTVKTDQTGTTPLKLLDGRDCSRLTGQRPGEIEQILTGLDNPETAGSVIRLYLVGIRSVIQLAALLTDESRMTSIRATAAAISAAIAAISAGSAVIDPELLAYLLAGGKAIAAGFSDCSRLLAGKGVALWPGNNKSSLQIWYQDFLRLFLLLTPQTTLLERCGALVAKVLPGSFYTGILVATTYRGRNYQLEGGYSS